MGILVVSMSSDLLVQSPQEPLLFALYCYDIPMLFNVVKPLQHNLNKLD